ncbi:MAG: hypothetical protein QM295_05130 [Bacillota bacterium]|nr:hypothetical protein [Bacillota bacterium]
MACVAWGRFVWHGDALFATFLRHGDALFATFLGSTPGAHPARAWQRFESPVVQPHWSIF